MKLSIIVPCKNEEGNVAHLYTKIKEVLQKIKYEIIYIDDGSTDNTLEELRKLYESDMIHIKVLSFSRNFKKEAAMLAGLEYASGEYTCIIDGDLQQNPQYLVQMADFLDKNKEYDEVAMVMKERTAESKFMSFCKKIFYNLINKISDVHFENNASDFRMFRENVKEAILSLPEKNRFTKGIFAWIGFHVKYLYYDVEERVSGVSKFNLKNSLTYALEGILAFSTKPLTFAIGLGFIFLLFSILYFIMLIIQICIFELTFKAIHLLIFLLLMISGIHFILIGILGLYLSKTYTELKQRPTYIIKEKLGFNEDSIL